MHHENTHWQDGSAHLVKHWRAVAGEESTLHLGCRIVKVIEAMVPHPVSMSGCNGMSPHLQYSTSKVIWKEWTVEQAH